jgi:hypothetical protein
VLPVARSQLLDAVAVSPEKPITGRPDGGGARRRRGGGGPSCPQLITKCEVPG